MLDARSHCGRVAQVFSLIALYHSHTHLHIQIWVLARSFGDAAPARVAGHVEHRRECPADTACRSLDGSNPGAFLNKGRVKCRCKSDRNRENGTESVNHVTTNKNRDSQTALLYGSLLDSIYLSRIHAVKYGTDFSFGSLVSKPRST